MPNTDASYSLTTLVGQVRLLTNDKDVTKRSFTDDEIEVFLALEGNNPLLAAALVLETMAANPVNLARKVSMPDWNVDYGSVANGMLTIAKGLRDRVAEGYDQGAVEIVEMVYDDFTARDRLWNEVLRSNG